jgi:hypothetical protein
MNHRLSPVLILTVFLLSPALGQDRSKDAKKPTKNDRSHTFQFDLDVSNQQNWSRFIRQYKARTLVKTPKGYFVVDLGSKTVGRSSKNLAPRFSKTYDPDPLQVTKPKDLIRPLLAFLSQLKQGRATEMHVLVYLPKGVTKTLEKLVEKRCYDNFVDIKDVTHVTLRFRQDQLRLGPITFLEQGQKKQL